MKPALATLSPALFSLLVSGCGGGDEADRPRALPPLVELDALRLAHAPTAKRLAAYYCLNVASASACQQALGAPPATEDLQFFIEVELSVTNEGEVPLRLQGALVEAALYPDDPERAGAGAACTTFCRGGDPDCRGGYDPENCPASADEVDQLLDKVIARAQRKVTEFTQLYVQFIGCMVTLGLACGNASVEAAPRFDVPPGETRPVRLVLQFDADEMAAVMEADGLEIAANQLSRGVLGLAGSVEINVPAGVRGAFWYVHEPEGSEAASMQRAAPVTFGPLDSNLTF